MMNGMIFSCYGWSFTMLLHGEIVCCQASRCCGIRALLAAKGNAMDDGAYLLQLACVKYPCQFIFSSHLFIPYKDHLCSLLTHSSLGFFSGMPY